MRIESSCIFGEEDKRHRKYLCVKLASYDIAGKFWDLAEHPLHQDFCFRPWNISHLPPSAKSQGSYGCERRFFSCYHDSRNNFVSPKFYSQILKERANGIHQKEDVLAIVFLNMPSVLIFYVKLCRHFLDAGHNSVASSCELAEFLRLPRIVKLCSTIADIQEHLRQTDRRVIVYFHIFLSLSIKWRILAVKVTSRRIRQIIAVHA